MVSKDRSERQKKADHLRREFRNKSLWNVDRMGNAEVIRVFGKEKKEKKKSFW